MIHRKNQCRTLIISRNTEIANYLILRMNSNLKSLKNLDAEIKTAITKKLQIHAFIFSIFILIQLKAQCLTNKSWTAQTRRYIHRLIKSKHELGGFKIHIIHTLTSKVFRYNVIVRYHHYCSSSINVSVVVLSRYTQT